MRSVVGSWVNVPSAGASNLVLCFVMPTNDIVISNLPLISRVLEKASHYIQQSVTFTLP